MDTSGAGVSSEELESEVDIEVERGSAEKRVKMSDFALPVHKSLLRGCSSPGVGQREVGVGCTGLGAWMLFLPFPQRDGVDVGMGQFATRRCSMNSAALHSVPDGLCD